MPDEWPHDRLGTRLQTEFGSAGVAVWPCVVAAAKRNINEGTFSFTTEEEAWQTLGLEPAGFSLEEFFRVTGALKETRRRCRGRVTDVQLRRWEELQQTLSRSLEAERKARSRANSNRDNTGTDSDGDSDRYRDSSLSSNGPTDKQLAYLADLGHQGPRPKSAREASELIDELRKPKPTEGRTDPSPDRNDPTTCPHLAITDDGWCAACGVEVGARP
jgi:hypothetical protein